MKSQNLFKRVIEKSHSDLDTTIRCVYTRQNTYYLIILKLCTKKII